MIKFCIVLTLLVAVANSASKCLFNQILSNSAACDCAASDNGGQPITTDNVDSGHWCMKTGSTYAIKTSAPSACTDDAKVVTGSECRVTTAAVGVKICINEQYRAPSAIVCSEWCTKGATTQCKTCGATKTECATCNTGHYYVSGTACAAQMCKKGKYVAGKDTNTAFAACDTGKEYDSNKADIACTSGCTSALCCKDSSSSSSSGSSSTSSSMSLAIQTVLIIGIMNFM